MGRNFSCVSLLCLCASFASGQLSNPLLSVRQVPSDNSGDRLDLTATYTSLADGRKYCGTASNDYTVNLHAGAYDVAVGSAAGHASPMSEWIAVLYSDIKGSKLSVDPEVRLLELDRLLIPTRASGCLENIFSLARLSLVLRDFRVSASSFARRSSLAYYAEGFCAHPSSSGTDSVERMIAEAVDRAKYDSELPRDTRVRVRLSEGLDGGKLAELMRAGGVLAYLVGPYPRLVYAIQHGAGSDPAPESYRVDLADQRGVPLAKLAHTPLLVFSAEGSNSRQSTGTTGRGETLGGCGGGKDDTAPTDGEVKWVSSILVSDLDAMTADFKKRSEGLHLVHTNDPSGYQDFLTTRSERAVYYLLPEISSLAREVKQKLLKTTATNALLAMADFVNAKFPRNDLINKAKTDLVPQALGRTFLDEISTFLFNLHRKASQVAIDLDVSSSPASAAVTLTTEAGRFRSVTTDGRMTNLYRGLYTYHIERHDAKPSDGQIDLIDDEGTHLHCDLAPTDGTAFSHCIFY